MRFFDAHNHLQDERFAGCQPDLIATCRQVGVVRMVVNGSTESDWPAVAALARQHPDLIQPSFGLHPWHVGARSAAWCETLGRYLETTPGAVMGEIGLDRWKRDLDFAEQCGVFRDQLQLAADLDLPVSIHCLQAWGPLFDILRAGPVPRRGFLLHSFGGPAEMIAGLARLGARFSLPGYFAHERKARQRAAFRQVPADRFLVETDAPDQGLPPGRTPFPLADPATGHLLNHPANLVAVYELAAGVLDCSLATVVDRVETNFTGLFGPTVPPPEPPG